MGVRSFKGGVAVIDVSIRSNKSLSQIVKIINRFFPLITSVIINSLFLTTYFIFNILIIIFFKMRI
jgi:hypothetical protein